MIPKDGKRYLACLRENGMFFVRWNNFDKSFVSYADGGKYCWLESSVVRWMDEHGQWHEIITQSDNTP